MHLYYDNKFYFIVLTIGILFLAIFIGFTMIDTERRGDLYQEVAHPINNKAAMYDSLSQTAAPHGHGVADSAAAGLGHEAADSMTAPVDSAASESQH
jgi:hypothetical protein